MALNVPNYSGRSGERVTSFLGATYVHGYDGEIWYVIADAPVTPKDIDTMLNTQPKDGKVVINSKTLGKWRESVGIGDNTQQSA